MKWLLFSLCTLIAATAFYLGSYFLVVRKSNQLIRSAVVGSFEYEPDYGKYLGFSEQTKKELFRRAHVLDKEILRRNTWKTGIILMSDF